MRTTWADTIQSEVTLLVTYPVAKDTGRWQAAKNFAPMPNVRVDLVVRTTEKSVTRGWGITEEIHHPLKFVLFIILNITYEFV